MGGTVLLIENTVLLSSDFIPVQAAQRARGSELKPSSFETDLWWFGLVWGLFFSMVITNTLHVDNQTIKQKINLVIAKVSARIK